jgi:hypothetical protein
VLLRLKKLYIMESPTRTDEGPIREFYLTRAAHLRCPSVKSLLAGGVSLSLNRLT